MIKLGKEKIGFVSKCLTGTAWMKPEDYEYLEKIQKQEARTFFYL